MAYYRERDLQQFAREVTHDGIGIGGGLVIGGLFGSIVESKLAKYDPFTGEYSNLLQKIWGWATNNGTKAVLYALAKKYDMESPMARKAAEALAGSVVYDTVIRLAHGGSPIPPPGVQIGGYRILGQGGIDNVGVEKLKQENVLLRTELNKALQKLAGTTGNIVPMPDYQAPNPPKYPTGLPYSEPATSTPYPGRPDQRTGSMEDLLPSNASPVPAARQKHFSAMPFEEDEKSMRFVQTRSPEIERTQRGYSFMPFVQNTDTRIRDKQREYGAMNPGTGAVQRQLSNSERRHLFGMNTPMGVS